MRLLLIVNPVSGRLGASPRRVRRAVESAFEALSCGGHAVEAILTRQRGHATELTAAAVDRGVQRVVAWGGDGTINEVANAMAGTTGELAIVPSGSGSGLARALGVPLDPRRALAVAITGRVRAIDVGRASGRAFVNVAGVGFDAHIAECFNAERRGRLGLAAYVRMTARELRRYRPTPCRVRVGAETFAVDPLLVAFANSPQYGNGARIAPGARLDDGLLDLVIVRRTTPLRDLWRARRLFTGGLEADPGAVMRRAAAMQVDADGPIGFHVDGEPCRAPELLAIGVQPLALRVVVPAGRGDQGAPGASSP